MANPFQKLVLLFAEEMGHTLVGQVSGLLLWTTGWENSTCQLDSLVKQDAWNNRPCFYTVYWSIDPVEIMFDDELCELIDTPYF